MKKISSIFVAFLLLIFSVSLIEAVGSYTLEEVATHASSADCWMAIDGAVYDVSAYLSEHDRELDIRPWCGLDVSEDYNTEAGRGKDHSLKADELLAGYKIGILSIAPNVSPTSAVSTTVQETIPKVIKKYNVLFPFLATIALYFLSMKFLAKPKHDFIWNSVMLLGLISSFIFGILMAMEIATPSLLYLHVELSIVFGVVCILHFLYRIKMYLSEGRFTLRKKKTF
jgi:predicted heme/steroid binding protein